MIAVIADDNTGGTDAAGMLSDQGLKVLFLLKPDTPIVRADLDGYDALVIGTRSRSIDPGAARDLLLRVYRMVEAINPDIVQFKYCSTFDSTKEGNIGQSLDAAAEVFGFRSSLSCSALPVNGRTTYGGYHFVLGELLSESPMKDHPLNPMGDANLVRWLQFQTDQKVGLIDWHRIRQGEEALHTRREELEEQGVRYIICDALEQDDIDLLVRSFPDERYWSGGSGLTASLGKELCRPASKERNERTFPGRRTLVVSGSRSRQASLQYERAVDAGFTSLPINADDILNGAVTPEELSREAAALYDSNDRLIIYLTDQKPGTQLNPIRAGEALAAFEGEVARMVVDECGVERLVAAGGETSGAISAACGFEALEIGRQISPGVPYCFPTNRENLLLVLKSGNFGGENLYEEVYRLS